MDNKKDFVGKKQVARQIAFTAVFAALCFVGTVVLTVPLPYGYLNVGDLFVLLAGWCLGPLYGFAAAALGSAAADILSGFALYAPVTFFVKGVDALVAYFAWKGLSILFRGRWDMLSRVISASVAEGCMVLGYFVYESFLYGIAGAAASLSGNALQALAAVVCGTILAACLRKLSPMCLYFPSFGKYHRDRHSE